MKLQKIEIVSRRDDLKKVLSFEKSSRSQATDLQKFFFSSIHQSSENNETLTSHKRKLEDLMMGDIKKEEKKSSGSTKRQIFHVSFFDFFFF